MQSTEGRIERIATAIALLGQGEYGLAGRASNSGPARTPAESSRPPRSNPD